MYENLNHISGFVVYGILAGFAAIGGVLITCAVVNVGNRKIKERRADEEQISTPLTTLLWWSWGAVLAWVMFIGSIATLIQLASAG